MPSNVASQTGRRTRLTPEREAELYSVVLRLLREVGYEALTLQAVASRGRCSTATLYRQWQGKPKLVVAALQHQRIQPVPAELDAHTGSLREALREMVRRVSRAAPPEHQFVAGLSHAFLGDPEPATAMHEQFTKPAAEIPKRIVDRAAARGEISPDNPAREFCHIMLVALGLTRPVLDGEEADEAYMLRLVDAVLLPSLRHPAPAES
ncbi:MULTISPECIES: TetR/AcrR family transcriptional regulator [unclassified Streptomyces]|uniref:TetR/AcrR family transcriptional regulator n=1 Tax=unclassified Streptomyces TaxID=2593676 RepID=UPI002476B9A6|nr:MULTISPECIES: TetR/AcrR family transcriptional regulator [unclassified Streptomyces]MDH6454362.1 AcrR family transcriptional regulator [Streptomyces sp. SAI-119]MDH6495079.1 AcrR family transcriptional regulator [Streptomyces sp. SAI-149]